MSYSPGATRGALCEQAAKRAPAFVAGFVRGFTCPFDLSPREVQEAYPQYSASEVDEYLNGFADGRADDQHRLRLAATTAGKDGER